MFPGTSFTFQGAAVGQTLLLLLHHLFPYPFRVLHLYVAASYLPVAWSSRPISISLR